MDVPTRLDFSSLPPIFILQANLPADDMHEAEDAIYEAGGRLTYSPREARIFVGRVSQKKRAAFELRSRGLWTEESSLPQQPPRKKLKLDPHARKQSLSGSETESEQDHDDHDGTEQARTTSDALLGLEDHVVVLKLQWLTKSLEAGVFLPPDPYLVYSGRIVETPQVPTQPSAPTQEITYIKAIPDDLGPSSSPQASSSLKRGESSLTSILDGTKLNGDSQPLPIVDHSPRRFRDKKHSHRTTLSINHPTLHRTTTSEHDFLDPSKPGSLPPPPDWMLQGPPRANYACTRSTFANPPNRAFIAHLDRIKEARLLTLDEIGVRAYSTSIAALSAYPHKITVPSEITRLPGCSEKIAKLWIEWFTSADPDAPDSERRLRVTDALDKDEDLKVLKLFWNIWGVGADTARKFYFERGWRDLDDVIEYGWHSGALNRVQQIGVKFYDGFLVKIPRKEVEEISDVILRHARLSRKIPEEWWSNKENGYRGNWTKPDDGHGDASWDPRDMVCVIVGGYRRGKTECGDVDVILSHRDEEYTKDLVVDVVKSLEEEEYITHTLTLHTTNSDRDQQTLPYKGEHTGHGFDTLDKALCVWQDPEFDRDKHERNPNIHRRVDIIVSPWRTVGAAVLGWSGATTNERDIRRWCRKEKGWKYDSSGVRDRANGAVLDFESPRTIKIIGKQNEGEVLDDGDGWEDRERRLMEGLGIGWRPARERVTG